MRRHTRPARSAGGVSRLAAAAVVALSLGLWLAGCGSVQPRYYTLTPYPGTPRRGGPATVKVQTPTVADYLSRDYIVLNNSGNQLRLARNAAWAEPLPAAIGRNLALDLSQRLPGSSVFTSNSGISSKADALVEVNVSQFAEDQAGQAEIMATVSVHRPDAPVADILSVHVVTPLQNRGQAALAASLSQALGQVADTAADDLRGLGARGRW